MNKSKLSGLVNVFTMVLPWVRWWWWCCCLFLRQCTRVKRLTTQVAAEVVAAVAVEDVLQIGDLKAKMAIDASGVAGVSD